MILAFLRLPTHCTQRAPSTVRPLMPGGVTPRHCRRQRLGRALFRPTASFRLLGPFRITVPQHRHLRLACGDVAPFAPWPCRPTTIMAGRSEELTSPMRDPAPNHMLPVGPLYPKPRSAAMAKHAPQQGTTPTAQALCLGTPRAQRAFRSGLAVDVTKPEWQSGRPPHGRRLSAELMPARPDSDAT